MKKYLTWRKVEGGWMVCLVTKSEDENGCVIYRPVISDGDEATNNAILEKFAPEFKVCQMYSAAETLVVGLFDAFVGKKVFQQ